MQTVTLSQKKYRILEKRALLYERLLKKEGVLFPVEIYSSRRWKEFLKEDKVNAKLRRQIEKLLRS